MAIGAIYCHADPELHYPPSADSALRQLCRSPKFTSNSDRHIVVRFGLDGAIYEVGFSFQAERQEIHAALLPFALGTVAIGLLLGGEALIAAYRGVPRLILPHGR